MFYSKYFKYIAFLNPYKVPGGKYYDCPHFADQ